MPAHDSDMSAADLLALAQGSGSVAYSGYAEAAGSLELPVTDQFSDVAKLLGDRTRLRVWWRSADDWRVDAVETAGESDPFRHGGLIPRWDYEANRVARSIDAGIRLPRTGDLLPPQLGRLVLGDARPDEVSRIGTERVAGVDAPGLRLVPAERQSTIDHVDVWVHPDTGLPLRLSAFTGGDSAAPVVTSTFLDLTIGMPPAGATRFVAPSGADMVIEQVVDAATAAEFYAPVRAPRRLAGLPPRLGASPAPGAVGEYGRGVTMLLAIPLWENSACPLREQLAKTPGVVVDADGTTWLSVGPLELLLTAEAFKDHSWLVAGTVTHATLVRAASQLRQRAHLWVAAG